MALLEAPGIGCERFAKALNPGCFMNMAAQAESDWIYFKKSLHTMTAAPKAEDDGPVADSPWRDMGDQDGLRCLPNLFVSRAEGEGD